MKNIIGIENKKAKKLVNSLNDLLANYQVFYQNLRGFHWNIKGKEFFELHLKFEEFYNDALLKVDEIAERILTLSGVPSHSFEDYIANSDIKSAKNKHSGEECIQLIIENFATLIQKERAILKQANNAEDEGTANLVSDYISQTEKTLWMLSAYMGE